MSLSVAETVPHPLIGSWGELQNSLWPIRHYDHPLAEEIIRIIDGPVDTYPTPGEYSTEAARYYLGERLKLQAGESQQHLTTLVQGGYPVIFEAPDTPLALPVSPRLDTDEPGGNPVNSVVEASKHQLTAAIRSEDPLAGVNITVEDETLKTAVEEVLAVSWQHATSLVNEITGLLPPRHGRPAAFVLGRLGLGRLVLDTPIRSQAANLHRRLEQLIRTLQGLSSHDTVAQLAANTAFEPISGQFENQLNTRYQALLDTALKQLAAELSILPAIPAPDSLMVQEPQTTPLTPDEARVGSVAFTDSTPPNSSTVGQYKAFQAPAVAEQEVLTPGRPVGIAKKIGSHFIFDALNQNNNGEHHDVEATLDLLMDTKLVRDVLGSYPGTESSLRGMLKQVLDNPYNTDTTPITSARASVACDSAPRPTAWEVRRFRPRQNGSSDPAQQEKVDPRTRKLRVYYGIGSDEGNGARLMLIAIMHKQSNARNVTRSLGV